MKSGAASTKRRRTRLSPAEVLGLGPTDRGPHPRARERGRATWRRAHLGDLTAWLGGSFLGPLSFAPKARLRRDGLDLVAPIGTEVIAPGAGRVVCRVSLHPGGVGLSIDHGGGLGSIVLGLARCVVSLGDTVERGEPLGLSGASHRDVFLSPFNPPGIRFVVTVAGEPVDPRPFLHDVVDDAAPTRPMVFDVAAIDDGITACRHVALRGSLDDLPTSDERAWALTFWRVVAPDVFTCIGPLGPTDPSGRASLGWPMHDVRT
jgi:hypothetical protein